MNTPLVALIRYCQLTLEHQPGDGKLDGEVHEHRRRVVYHQGRGQREP